MNPGDTSGRAAVRKTYDVALKGARGAKHSLELNACNDIGIPAVTEFAFSRGIELFKAGGKDDRADLQLDRPLFHSVVDCVLLAGLDALVALRAQGTIQTSFGFRQGLLLGESFFNLFEIRQPVCQASVLRD